MAMKNRKAGKKKAAKKKSTKKRGPSKSRIIRPPQ
jgi:hypothetical protein